MLTFIGLFYGKISLAIYDLQLYVVQKLTSVILNW